MLDFDPQHRTGHARGMPYRRRMSVALPVRPPGDPMAAQPIRHVNTSHLRRFVLLMQYCSAVEAARHSGINPPCFHYAVRRLEDRLGTALFVREASSMHPTAAARRLYPCAVRLLAMWDDLVEPGIGETNPPPPV